MANPCFPPVKRCVRWLISKSRSCQASRLRLVYEVLLQQKPSCCSTSIEGPLKRQLVQMNWYASSPQIWNSIQKSRQIPNFGRESFSYPVRASCSAQEIPKNYLGLRRLSKLLP